MEGRQHRSAEQLALQQAAVLAADTLAVGQVADRLAAVLAADILAVGQAADILVQLAELAVLHSRLPTAQGLHPYDDRATSSL